MNARWPLACFLVMGVFWGTWAALLPQIKAQLGATDGELGLAMVGAGVGSLPAMIATGRLWRRLGWWLLPATCVAFAVACLGPLLATTPLALGVALVFVGASSGALDVAMNSAVSDVEVAQDRRLMYGAHALFSLAVLVASVSTGLARQVGAGLAPMLSVSALLFAVVAVGATTAARQASLGRSVAGSGVQSVGRLAVRVLATLAVLCALSFLIEDAIQNWSALLLEREIGSGPAIGGAGPGVFAGAMFLGRSAGQWLGARFSDRALLIGGAVVAAVGLVLAATAVTAPVALVGLGLGGAGVALVAPALFARAGRLTDAAGRGAAIATMTTFGYLGFVIGPVVVGLVAQTVGLRAAFGLMAGLAAALAIAGAIALGTRTSEPGSVVLGEELLRTSRG
jgi:MFS family permease